MKMWDPYFKTLHPDQLAFQDSFEFEKPPVEAIAKPQASSSLLLCDVNWPRNELSLINCADVHTTVQLIMPFIEKESLKSRWVTLISPPKKVIEEITRHSPAILSRIQVSHPRNGVDDKISLNKALKNGTSEVVIYWSDNLPDRNFAQWRKSVKQGNSTGIVINLSRQPCNSRSIALVVDVEKDGRAINLNSRKPDDIYAEEITFNRRNMH